MKILAIIPARSGSKRIPNKNIIDFGDQPIISYPIKTLVESNFFSEVMVSTDCPKIATIAQQHGATIPFYRSADNSDDFATTTDVILEVLNEYQKMNIYFDYTCCIYPTAVFVTCELIETALQSLLDNSASCVFPIVKFSYPPQRGLTINENGLVNFLNPQYEFTRSQDLPSIFHDSGQFYFFKTDDFLQEKRLILSKTKPIIVEETKIQDIDNLTDLEIAELKYKLQINK